MSESGKKAPALGVAEAGWGVLVGEPFRVLPHRHAVRARDAVKGPARQRLARIPLALAEVQQPAGRGPLAQPPNEEQRAGPLDRAQGLQVPLRTLWFVDAHESRFASHGQAHVLLAKTLVDRVGNGSHPLPGILAERPVQARSFMQAPDREAVAELHARRLDRAGDGRGLPGAGRTHQRNMPFRGEQPGGRVHADPARARQENLHPRMQIGRIHLRTGPLALCCRLLGQLDQVSRNEARRHPERSKHLHQQPGGVAA